LFQIVVTMVLKVKIDGKDDEITELPVGAELRSG
jgi:hypothetical protein